jgi:hypothetical protein
MLSCKHACWEVVSGAIFWCWGKFVLCRPWRNMKSSGQSPLILNFCTWWKREVALTRPLFLRWKMSDTHRTGGCVDPKSILYAYTKEIKALPLPGSEPHFLERPKRWPVTTPTELPGSCAVGQFPIIYGWFSVDLCWTDRKNSQAFRN